MLVQKLLKKVSLLVSPCFLNRLITQLGRPLPNGGQHAYGRRIGGCQSRDREDPMAQPVLATIAGIFSVQNSLLVPQFCVKPKGTMDNNESLHRKSRILWSSISLSLLLSVNGSPSRSVPKRRLGDWLRSKFMSQPIARPLLREFFRVASRQRRLPRNIRSRLRCTATASA